MPHIRPRVQWLLLLRFTLPAIPSSITPSLIQASPQPHQASPKPPLRLPWALATSHSAASPVSPRLFQFLPTTPSHPYSLPTSPQSSLSFLQLPLFRPPLVSPPAPCVLHSPLALQTSFKPSPDTLWPPPSLARNSQPHPSCSHPPSSSPSIPETTQTFASPASPILS